ncbi:MAG: hypothetical protein MI864_27870 [Pseudomonadales bacterium]|uniref:Uncharacterized protein n=1 Tax=Oleiphilus messinensis TaxID=141451 RepID=A0A1Y0I2I1_9GAMM|nr:hypothetical protein [Oleiphilus messinensis]ARU54460.1 hypothetical protein OLMES_0356 [Oleiphilus messinensis]MCG8614348.1 hypothetical protein [Pseudomonadales bacterium]
MNNIIKLVAVSASVIWFNTALAEAVITEDEPQKTTIDTFPFQMLEQDDLSQAVIEGGLEPPAAGEEEAPVQNVQEPYKIEVVDRQTDLGRHEVPVEFHYSNPRVVPGVVFNEQYRINPQ